MRVIGVGINVTEEAPFRLVGGDRLLERDFLHEIDAVKFAQGMWKDGETVTHMMLLRIDRRNPKVIAVLDLKKEVR